MKPLLFILTSIFLFSLHHLSAQDSCHNAIQIFSMPVQTFTLTDTYNPQPGPYYGNHDSLMSFPNWFYGKVTWPGYITMSFKSTDPNDITSFAIWGPFNDVTSPCISQLTASTHKQHGVDNDFHIFISNALIGEYYLFCLSKMTDTLQVEVDSAFQSFVYTPNAGLLGMNSFDCSLTNSLYPIQICMATGDSITGKNKIIVNSNYNSISNPISHLTVYRENASLIFDSIGTIPAGSNTFVDLTSNSFQQSYRYRLSFTDTCGNTSAYSTIHRTIHLLASNGAMGGINLDWNQYNGFPYTTHYIFKKTNNNPYTLLDSVSYNVTTYTDMNGPFPNVKYRIAVKNPNSCGSSIKSSDYVYSNEIDSPSGMYNTDQEHIQAYPNPFSDYTLIAFPSELKDIPFVVCDITGKVVREFRFSGNTMRFEKHGLTPGFYTLQSDVLGVIKVIVR